MKKLLSTALSVCCIVTSHAQDISTVEAQVVQELQGTLFTKSHRETAEGQLQACGMEFAALERDFSTKGGAPIRIVGSFYMRASEKWGLSYALKLGVLDGLNPKSGAVAPFNAFIRAPTGNAPKKAIRALAENEGFALFAGALDEDVVAAYQAIVEEKKLVVGFNRRPGELDVNTTLDLTVIDTTMSKGKALRERSTQTVDEFVVCTGALFKRVKR